MQILQICKSAKSANSTENGQNGPKALPFGQKFRLGCGSTVCGARTFLFFETPRRAPPLHFFDFLLHSEAKYRLVRVNSRFCRFLQIFADFADFCRFFADFCGSYEIHHPVCDACDMGLIVVVCLCVSGFV